MPEAAAPRRKQGSVVVARQGGQASIAVVAAAIAGVCGWLCWRRWKARQDSSSSSSKRCRSSNRPGVRPAGNHASTAAAGISSQPAFYQPSGRAANMAGGRRVNPKKDKANRRQQRAEKRLVQASDAAGKAASGKQEEEGPVVQRYVDLTQTAEVYDKVRQYQETGKKRFP